MINITPGTPNRLESDVAALNTFNMLAQQPNLIGYDKSNRTFVKIEQSNAITQRFASVTDEALSRLKEIQDEIDKDLDTIKDTGKVLQNIEVLSSLDQAMEMLFQITLKASARMSQDEITQFFENLHNFQYKVRLMFRDVPSDEDRVFLEKFYQGVINDTNMHEALSSISPGALKMIFLYSVILREDNKHVNTELYTKLRPDMDNLIQHNRIFFDNIHLWFEHQFPEVLDKIIDESFKILQRHDLEQ